VCAIAFNLIPLLASDVPLSRRLSSDAEWYAVALMRLAEPPMIASDDVYALDLLPGTEQIAVRLLGGLGRLAGLDVLDWTVLLSFAILIIFVLGAYSLTRATLPPSLALLVSLALIVPAHALGATQLGFQAMGFLPRDLGLALSMFVLLGYIRGERRTGPLAVAFLCCGLLANVYSMLYAHLGLVLLGAEALRDRGLRPRLITFAALLVIGALPTGIAVLTRGAFSPPDLEILRIREASLLLGPFPAVLTQLLRRPIIYAGLLIVIVTITWRWGMLRRHEALTPWFAVATSAVIVTVLGLVVENATPFVRFLPSRASVFFLLAAMVLCAGLIPDVVERWRSGQARALGFAILAAIFLLQSNLPTVARQLSDDVVLAAQRRDLARVADRLAASTSFADVFLAPADELPDVAASLRTYARRPTFVSFKDLGIVLYDGARARTLFSRWEAAQSAIRAPELDTIRAFLREHRIAAAIAPSTIRGGDSVPTADRFEGFVIVRP
jgi:hypothetical protein